MPIEPRFLELNGARLFCLYGRSAVPPRLQVLIAPPFAEELNKCRRLLGRIVRRLVDGGCDVLLPDLYGTGDSEGAFAEATWERWTADLAAAEQWLAGHSEAPLRGWLAVRSGALLLADSTRTNTDIAAQALVAIQPVPDGRRMLQQFLRLRAMASKFAGGEETVASLEGLLERGESVEVAGYEISAALAVGLGQARLDGTRLPHAARSTLLEFRASEGGSVSRPVQAVADALADEGRACEAVLVQCEQFWTTQEISAPTPALEAACAPFGAAAA